MSKTVKINFTLNNQNFKKVIQCSKSEVENGELATVFDIEEFKKQIKKIHISGDVMDYDELCKIITESFNVRIYKRAYIIECEAEIEVEEIETVKKEITETKEEVKVIEVQEQKEVIYHSENSNWYLINDNYKDAETIEEEGIDLTQYKIVKIESSECNIDYGFDEFNGVAKCYTWEGQDGIWYLEEEGCFTKFNSCEELESFMNTEY